jgi:hypothetical protein
LTISRTRTPVRAGRSRRPSLRGAVDTLAIS